MSLVATLIRLTDDWELAEDCVQDAAARALERWPADGVPDRPAAWLTTVARCALDVLRRRTTERGKLAELMVMDTTSDDLAGFDISGPADDWSDDRLRLIFTCCHPALPMAGRVALTLKTVAGLTTAEIARALLCSESTMAQRLLRARNKINHAGLPYRVPAPNRLATRLAGVLAVVYLSFNQGYGEPGVLDELADEALRLSALLADLLPSDAEVRGLHALLLCQQSRLASRTDADGELISMEAQDRRLWNRAMVEDGVEAVLRARSLTAGQPPGPYLLQAEIAARHVAAAGPASTDWPGIVAAYTALVGLTDSPVVALNRAVALGFRDGPEAGIAELERLRRDGGLERYHLLPAARADLARRAGLTEEAASAYREALALAPTARERRYLQRKLDQLSN